MKINLFPGLEVI